MAAFRTAFGIVIFSVRVIRVLIRIANLLIVVPIILKVACFVAYWVGLPFSYAFLAADWTLTTWQSASQLYAGAALFKAATIASFAFLCLPILAVWSDKPPRKTSNELNGVAAMAIAARQQDEGRGRYRRSVSNSCGSPPSWCAL